jgi:hypothetical protein
LLARCYLGDLMYRCRLLRRRQRATSQQPAEPGRSPAIPAEKGAQLAALRAAFIPWLARIDPETGAAMRRVARLSEIPDGSRPIVERLVDARLLVSDRRAGIDAIEVAHESLLRQWPALTAWLDADSADLKLVEGVEGVERAAGEWVRNDRLEAWLDHRADRLGAAERLVARNDFRKRLGEEGAAYLAACREREDMERKEREEALAREEARLAEITVAQARAARFQRRARWSLMALAVLAVIVAIGLVLGVRQLNARQRALDEANVNLFPELAAVEQTRGNFDGALRFAVHGARLSLGLEPRVAKASPADAELAAAASQSGWRLLLSGTSTMCTPPRSAPEGPASSRRRWTRRPGSGTPRRRSRWRCCAGTRRSNAGP